MLSGKVTPETATVAPEARSTVAPALSPTSPNVAGNFLTSTFMLSGKVTPETATVAPALSPTVPAIAVVPSTVTWVAIPPPPEPGGL